MLPSDGTETWGLVVSRILTRLWDTVVVSDAVGCAPDLVQKEKQALFFPAIGNTAALAEQQGGFSTRLRKSRISRNDGRRVFGQRRCGVITMPQVGWYVRIGRTLD